MRIAATLGPTRKPGPLDPVPEALPVRPLPVPRPLAVALGVLVLLVPAVAGCTTGAGPGTRDGALTVTGAWARPAEAGGTSAAYLELHNGLDADAVLTGASSAAAGRVSLHETSTDASGMTGMHHVPSVTIPAGETLRLEPGGYHIMLEQLVDDLAEGSTVALQLTFHDLDPLDVTAEVRAP
jgi:copper(I)-binding protein